MGPLELMTCDICHYIAMNQNQLMRKWQPFVRLACFFHAESQLKFCNVCCYAIFLHGSGKVDAESSSNRACASEEAIPHPSQFKFGRLAIYKPADWARHRPRAEPDDTDSVAFPFVSLQRGGLAGTAITTATELRHFLAARVTGMRHLPRERESSASSLQMVAVRGGVGDDSRSMQLCNSSKGLRIDKWGAMGALSVRDEAAICGKLRVAFKETIAFQKHVSRLKRCGRIGFSEAMANPEASVHPLFSAGEERQVTRN